jgi:C4-dicarboxylate-specific signal transduction histidine kinase
MPSMSERLRAFVSGLFLRAYRRPLRFLLGLVILPLALAAWLAYAANAGLWREQTLHNLGVTARLAAEIIDETLESSLRFSRLLAAQPGFAEALRRGDRETLARRLREALPFADRLDLAMVVGLDGAVVAAAPDRPELIGRHVGADDAFAGARASSWRPYISAVYLREGPEVEKVVAAVEPIEDGGGPIGLLQVQHRVETVKAWIQKLRIDPEGFLYVVDHRDQLVVYPFQVLPGKPKTVSDWPPVAQPVSGEGTTLVFRDARRRATWLAAVHPVGETGWRVVAVQPERAALRSLHRISRILGAMIALLLALTTLVSLRWARLQALSLRLLEQNAKLMKQHQQRRLFDRPKPPPAGGPP